MRILSLVAISSVFWSPMAVAQAAELTPSQCYIPYYTASQSAEGLVSKASADWENLDVGRIRANASALENKLGFASAIYAQTVAQGAAIEFELELLFDRWSEIHALIARLSRCDTAYGFAPAIVPLTDTAVRTVEMQSKLAAVPAQQIVACHRAYTAGESYPAVTETPVAELWNHASTAYFGPRVEQLENFADVTDAYSNIPASDSSLPASETWLGRLPAAVQSENPVVENAFWAEVSQCDSLIEILQPITAGPLISPEASHQTCASIFTVLRELHRQDQAQQTYFHQRGIYAARLDWMTGTVERSDQEIFEQIAALAQTRHQDQFNADGTPNYSAILDTFFSANLCELQYGMTPTVVPQQVRQAAKQ